MVFSSFTFLFAFFPLILVIYFFSSIPQERGKKWYFASV